ncbi:MAG TPA: hypothetical protein PKC62_05700 [Ferruginibacter sp.]|jgi:hypothetical protein|nr:hypothetical protein [Bacteroidota bacterium]MBS1925685.1 hypothetical protein [Bacteroidota bacterium]MCC6692276.1 hypothetical protein [Chitinophagaceae bacterium]HMT96163.1 hypothetical protein [Ferruginibacter sp.]HMU25663.1 hypothetical protein [Ferruginibacter sp.]
MIRLKKILGCTLFLFWANTSQQAFCQDSMRINTIDEVKEYLGKLNVEKDSFSLERGKKMIAALKHMNFKKGNLYFSGAGFPKVILLSFSGNLGWIKVWEDVTHGSTVTFDKCILILKDSLRPVTINKSIFFK